MSAARTTTIRVPTQTRDRLRALSSRRGESAGETVTKLVDGADEDAMLEAAAAGFQRLAENPAALAAYRSQAGELGGSFDASAPGW